MSETRNNAAATQRVRLSGFYPVAFTDEVRLKQRLDASNPRTYCLPKEVIEAVAGHGDIPPSRLLATVRHVLPTIESILARIDQQSRMEANGRIRLTLEDVDGRC